MMVIYSTDAAAVMVDAVTGNWCSGLVAAVSADAKAAAAASAVFVATVMVYAEAMNTVTGGAIAAAAVIAIITMAADALVPAEACAGSGCYCCGDWRGSAGAVAVAGRAQLRWLLAVPEIVGGVWCSCDY